MHSRNMYFDVFKLSIICAIVIKETISLYELCFDVKHERIFCRNTTGTGVVLLFSLSESLSNFHLH